MQWIKIGSVYCSEIDLVEELLPAPVRISIKIQIYFYRTEIMKIKNGILVLILLVFSCIIQLKGQQIPDNPTSIQIFSPQVYNPAMTGSKDYMNIHMAARLEGHPKAQIIAIHTRLLRSGPDYLISEPIRDFSNFGVGTTLFNDRSNQFRNIGLRISGAYHIPLSRKAISFLSFGVSLNGAYSIPDKELLETVNGDLSNAFYPNADLGLFFYNPRIFAGFSVTNIMKNVMQADSLEATNGLTGLGMHFQAGYKIVLSRSQSIILEPSIYINTSDSTLDDLGNNINPTLKLYFKNFFIGTYYSSKDLLSYFMQYQFGRIYAGFFIEFPIEKLVNQRNMKIELSVGMNIPYRDVQPVKERFW